jgi:FAD:protein FMN transferase
MRRQFVLAALAALLVITACIEPGRVERRWPVMGTYALAELHTATQGGVDELLEEIRLAFEQVDATMSNWKPDSELSILNREAAQGSYEVQDPDLYRVLKVSLEYARETRGAFDPTVGPLMQLYGFRPRNPRVPSEAEIVETLERVGWRKAELIPAVHAIRFLAPGMEIDLGGIAKGFALDVAARAFARPGVRAGLIGIGGSLYAWNAPPGEDAWRVGVQDPSEGSSIIATLKLRGRAVATSGNYENFFTEGGRTYGHLMDARTGRPAETDILAVTVVADSGMDADAVSTALYVGGSQRAADLLAVSHRLEAVMLVETQDGPTLLVSGSLRDRLEVTPEFRERIGGRIRYLLPPAQLLPSAGR